MWIIALETLVGLALFLLIVWLTMAPSKRRDEQTPPQIEQRSEADEKR